MFEDLSNACMAYTPRSRSGYSSNFPYIRYNVTEFARTIKPLLKPGMSVIDVGCGAGDKLLAFKDLEPTLTVTGLEYNQMLCAYARYMAPFAAVVEADALDYTYHAYDLIYMYWPICDVDKQFQLQQLVMQTMKPGAVFVCKCAQMPTYARDTFSQKAYEAHHIINSQLYNGWTKPGITYSANL